MFEVTTNAVNQLQLLLTQKGLHPASDGLRLGVEKGGCAGLQYTMHLGTPEAGDQIVETCGVRVFLDPESLPYLSQAQLDYVDGLADSGFRIQNPNASRSCGCGTSFEAAPSPDPAPSPGSAPRAPEAPGK